LILRILFPRCRRPIAPVHRDNTVRPILRCDLPHKADNLGTTDGRRNIGPAKVRQMA
jgi:hypothetical protein